MDFWIYIFQSFFVQFKKYYKPEISSQLFRYHIIHLLSLPPTRILYFLNHTKLKKDLWKKKRLLIDNVRKSSNQWAIINNHVHQLSTAASFLSNIE